MENIIDFKKYVDNKSKKVKKILSTNDIVESEGYLTSSDRAALKKVVICLADGDLHNIMLTCKRKRWTFKLILNDVEYTKRSNYILLLDLDPDLRKYNEGIEDTIYLVAADVLNDAILDMMDGLTDSTGDE